jgi:hypothetical protein
LFGAKGKDDLAELPIPARFILAPASLAAGSSSINVAQAYVRYAEGRAAGRTTDPNFDTALDMHHTIDAIERSAAAQ